MKLRQLLSVALLCTLLPANSMTLNEAKKLYREGRFEEALPTFMENWKRNKRNANLNQWVGACLYETGKIDESVEYLEFANSRKVADAARYLAQIALLHLDYDKAEELIDEYDSRIDDDDELSETARIGRERVKRALSMLNNVEKIQIIDSLVVEKKDFFKHYKFSPETGTLNTTDILPYEKTDYPTAVFVPESKSRMIWAMPDTSGMARLTETYQLYDGKWDKYTWLDKMLNDNGDANYPFVMADGTTLYYACNGENSIGGYDIFMSRKDLDTGEYLQPQNIGMPYNSPYDDYMFVIDELTGVGWWATDRNQIPDSVTIYIFIPNEIRENYDPSLENIVSLASIHSIRDTWNPNADYESILSEIANITPVENVRKPDFIFHVHNGITYMFLEDFKSAEARSMMQKYLSAGRQFDKDHERLKGLRSEYNKANSQNRQRLGSTILSLERKLMQSDNALKSMANSIRSAELSTINRRK